MTPERKQEYKDSIDSALALLMDFRKALDRPQIVSSRCAYCDKTFGEVESGECPPALLEHAKTCSKSPPANEIKRLQGLLKVAKCPNCDGSGAMPHQVADGEWEAEQCQWCDETKGLKE